MSAENIVDFTVPHTDSDFNDLDMYPAGLFHFPDGQDIDFSEFPTVNPNDIFMAGLLTLNAVATFDLVLNSKIDAVEAFKIFKKDGGKFLGLVSDKGFAAYHFLYLAFLTEACLHIKAESSEESLYPVFKRDVGALIPGAQIIPTVSGKHGRPDFCVSVDGEPRPVEIKAKKFIATNVKQLRRYMDGMKSSHGYAVAPALGCVLPKDMTFIPIQFESKEVSK